MKIIYRILLFLLVFTFLSFNTREVLFASLADYNLAKVSLTFDDGFESVYTNALPILSQKNIKATVYITTSYIGQPGYMTWDQVISLQNDYGWEIGSHTVTHLELEGASVDNIVYEVKNSFDILSSFGLQVTNFASPFGTYDNNALAVIAKYYKSHRGFWDVADLNLWPYDKTLLMDKMVDSTVSLATIYAYIDQAKLENKWLIFTLHDIQPSKDLSNEYVTTIVDLQAMVDYIVNSGLDGITVEESLVTPTNNLVVNPGFEDGFDNWVTDNALQVTVDSNENGRYPSPALSIKMLAGVNKAHLFSSRIEVSPDAQYSLSSFINANYLTGGETGFYIDEYDASGNWISGQWLGLVKLGSIVEFSKIYTPSSSQVSSISLQTYLVAGSIGYTYVDNFKFYNLNEITPTPTPTDEPTPTPTPTDEPTPTPTPTDDLNMVQNPSFEEVDEQDWPLFWTKDDNQSYFVERGVGVYNGANWMHLNGSGRAHIFSALVDVSSSGNYIWSQYIKVDQITGEFGFYIDEYDANGNWISGQWKGMVAVNQDGIVQIVYQPTSAKVARVGLQYYFIGDLASVYIDLVKFLAQ